MANSDEDLRSIGLAVQARRGELGMTQDDLAEAAHVDIKTVRSLEHGRRWPIAKNRAAIAAALGWQGDALAGLRREPPRPEVVRLPSLAAVSESDPWFLELPEDVSEQDIKPFIDDFGPRVARLLLKLRREEKVRGKDLFADPHVQALWDTVAASPDMTPEAALRIVATYKVKAERSDRKGHASGLIAVPST